MVENNKITLSEYSKLNQIYGLCTDCSKQNTFENWCQNCNSKRFHKDFNKWTSGNELIDEFIRNAQSNAKDHLEVIEWIPYDRLRNIKKLAQGGFSTIYKAILLDGFINEWDRENQQWKRYCCEIKDEDYENAKKQENIIKSPLNENEKDGYHVVLKSLDNSSNIIKDFLNELKIYLNFVYSAKNDAAQLYGITQDPKTSNYMIVMQYMELGSLSSNLMVKKYNPIDKYHNLFWIAKSLLTLHECKLVHGDFHSGNLLLLNNLTACLSDFGLSKPADTPTVKSDEIYGVIPYMAPEVLRAKPYTKAADIYSFGIIMWEMTSGIPAFNNLPHDFYLSLNICKGERPKIVKGKAPKIFDDPEDQKIFEVVEVEYTELMKRCWDSDPDNRPTAEELYGNFSKWFSKFYINDKRIPVPENEPIIQNHPLSCYTSKKIDYSAKLNKFLNQEELSSKIMVHNTEANYYETSLI